MNEGGSGNRVRNLRQEIVGIDQPVPLLDGTSRPYVYLDNAASTPTFRGVQDKVNEFLTWYSSIHRGTGFKSLVASQAYDTAREIVAEFVGADPTNDVVVFGKNTTEAVNKLANRFSFQPDDMILATLMEHHSNDLPWRGRCRLEYVEVLADGSLDWEDYERKLIRWKGKIRLVATTGAANVTGYLPPIYQMARFAHEHGALIMVDAAQLAPHRRIQMGAPGSPERLDFVALSAHKMYAPFGTGALIGPRAFFANGPPDTRGGGTIEIVSLEEVFWADPPDRDEAGSPNVVGAVALAAGISILKRVGMEVLAEHETALTRYTLERMGQIPGLRIFGSSDPLCAQDRLGVIAFQLEGIPHAKVAAILGYEGGIGVRSGCFCAHPYVLRLLGTNPAEYERFKQRVLAHDRSTLPGLIRASFGCYNNIEDVDRLLDWLDRIRRGQTRGEYELHVPSGAYRPRQFAANPADYFSLR
ncbi:MAG: aminotransferase class V-fold PLP-dependent enzyme [bacterium]